MANGAWGIMKAFMFMDGLLNGAEAVMFVVSAMEGFDTMKTEEYLRENIFLVYITQCIEYITHTERGRERERE